jgi:hypothetical protein
MTKVQKTSLTLQKVEKNDQQLCIYIVGCKGQDDENCLQNIYSFITIPVKSNVFYERILRFNRMLPRVIIANGMQK